MLPCCLLLIRWKFFINEPDKIHHQSRVTRDSTSWDKQAYIHDALWRQHYITTSKEYLTNSHILSIHFKLAFLQLHLVKISCKLIIIWVNYERNKKGVRFFETKCSSTCSTNYYSTGSTFDRRHITADVSPPDIWPCNTLHPVHFTANNWRPSHLNIPLYQI